MSSTRTVIDTIHVDGVNGFWVQVLWAKQILDDEGEVTAEAQHSTLFEPGGANGDIAAVIAANNADLAAMGYTPPVDDAWATVQAQITATFTPAAVTAWQAVQAPLAPSEDSALAQTAAPAHAVAAGPVASPTPQEQPS